MDKSNKLLLIICLSILIQSSKSFDPTGKQEWWSDATDKVDAVFALPGDTTTLPCKPPSSKNDEIISLSSFKWTDRLGEEPSDGRFSTGKDGRLKVEIVEPKDVGMYTCHAKGKDSNGKEIAMAYEHHLIVYRIPIITYEHNYVYKYDKCTGKQHIGPKIDEMLDHFCKVSEDDCNFKFEGKCATDQHMVILIHQTTEQSNIAHCGYKCTRDEIHNVLKKEYEAKVKEWTRLEKEDPSKSHLDTTKATPLLAKKSVCQPGYKMYKYALCLPCPPGQYSQGQSDKCTACGLNHFQSEWGSAHCHKCPHNTTTKEVGSSLITMCEGKGTMHLDGAGVHVQVQKKTMKFWAIMLIGTVLLAIKCGISGVLFWHFKMRKKPKSKDKALSKGSLIDGAEVPASVHELAAPSPPPRRMSGMNDDNVYSTVPAYQSRTNYKRGSLNGMYDVPRRISSNAIYHPIPNQDPDYEDIEASQDKEHAYEDTYAIPDEPIYMQPVDSQYGYSTQPYQ